MNSESQVNYRWKNIVVMLAICAAGLAALSTGAFIEQHALKHIVSTFGESLLVGGLLGFVFEMALRRDILHMIFEMRESIDVNKRWGEVAKGLGLQNIYKSDRELDTQTLIRDSVNLVLIMNDGRTWLSSHEADIEDRLARADRETTVYFVHPNSPHLLSLARKVDATEEELKNKAAESIRLLRRLQKNGHRLRVYGHFLPASYSLIHTENLSCQIPYPIGRKVEQVPVFVFAKQESSSSAVYGSIARDIEVIHQHASELFPNQQMELPGVRL